MKLKEIKARKPVSIKWKLFGGLIFFIAIVILVLWLLQVFFLERFYMYIKSNAVKEAASKINEIINEENFSSQIQSIAKENDFCVAVYQTKETEIGNLQDVLASNQDDFRCRIGDIRKDTKVIAALQQEVVENGGIASKLMEESDANSSLLKSTLGKNPFDQRVNLDPMMQMQKKVFYNMTYISVVQSDHDTLKTIIIDAQLTPVNATIDTIKAQFVIITIILVLVAFGLAFYLSRKIATPIIQINESAKQLAKGEYHVEFKGRGYLEAKELNDTLYHASIELSKVENLRKELIANMSHDLRTPLTMIAGYGEVMRDIPGENTPENVQIIIDETTRLTTLVNDMLDLSKLQSGVMELNTSTFNITREIKNIIARYDKLLSNQEIKIDFIYEEEVMVNGDCVKLDQVIYNLINNAINYCGEDHLVIVKQMIHDDRACFQFIDHGEGMDQDQLPYIWDRYYKVDKTHVRSKVGSGLGLSIVKAILELHQAEFGVRSKVNEGTDFWFILPIDETKEKA